MNPESSSFSRCGRHPSQFFTGFCSSCLVERLSTVASVDSSPKLSCNQRRSLSFDSNKDGCCGVSVANEGAGQAQSSVNVSGFERKSCDVRVRKTLGSLFHAADDDDQNAVKNLNQIKTLIGDDDGFLCGKGVDSGQGVRFVEKKNGSETIQVGANFDSETRVPGSVNAVGSDKIKVGANFDSEAMVPGSVCAVDANACVEKKTSSEEDENLRWKGRSFWFGSVFSGKLLKWRMKNTSKKESMQAQNCNGGFGERDLETVVDFRRSCDHRVPFNLNKPSWEDPRHSWDGFLIGKAFTHSFAVTGEAENLNLMKPSDVYGGNDSIGTVETSDCLSNSSRNLPQETRSVDSKPTTDTKDISKINPSGINAKSIPTEAIVGDPFRDSPYRKKSHGWSKVWNRSITSPLWGSNKKCGSILDRSLSGSWQELTRGSENRVDVHSKNKMGSRNLDSDKSAMTTRALNGGKSIGNGDIQRLWPDRQTKKKDCNFGRSRSVHYSSPRNLDSGLLRFYLTPLRTSRSKSKNRTKGSQSFARGILSFH